MKTFHRVFFGLSSSLLLSAGFGRAAAGLEPTSRIPAKLHDARVESPSEGCVLPCHYWASSVVE